LDSAQVALEAEQTMSLFTVGKGESANAVATGSKATTKIDRRVFMAPNVRGKRRLAGRRGEVLHVQARLAATLGKASALPLG
jgi:hypothetical protein